ncbi:MAG: glycogen/starch synthase [Bacteroidales bacterium]|nr:glycogen/starch synthase [Bacteroidales bacterium]
MTLDKALFISQEINPYLPSTLLSDLCRDLPQRIQEKGVEVRTFMPKYGAINERRNQLHEVIRLSGLNIVIDDNDHPLIIKVATLQPSRMQVYFIDNDDYFCRNGASQIETVAHPEDNDERIMFFARGVLETVKKLRWVPSVIQCTGWVTALAPIYIRGMYRDDPTLKDSKIVFSIFNDRPVAPLDPRIIDKLKMDGFSDTDLKSLTDAEQIDDIALSKLAIDFSDAVSVACADAPQELVDYAIKSGKPFMPYPGEESYADACHEFYKSL